MGCAEVDCKGTTCLCSDALCAACVLLHCMWRCGATGLPLHICFCTLVVVVCCWQISILAGWEMGSVQGHCSVPLSQTVPAVPAVPLCRMQPAHSGLAHCLISTVLLFVQSGTECISVHNLAAGGNKKLLSYCYRITPGQHQPANQAPTARILHQVIYPNRAPFTIRLLLPAFCTG